MKVKIGDRIRSVRKERRWTQAQVAKLLGLSQSRYSEIENGKGSLSAEQLLLFLSTFEISLQEFLGESPDPEQGLAQTLAGAGASHLATRGGSVPLGASREIHDVIVQVLACDNAPRFVTAIAPVIAHEGGRLNFQRVRQGLAGYGFGNRLGWCLENVLAALQEEVAQSLPRSWEGKCRQAILRLQEFLRILHVEDGAEDLFDPAITSEKTKEKVLAERSELARKWHLITRIRVSDFSEALRMARPS